jgi:hypothetical protein
VIAHVLINHSPLNVNCFIVVHLLLHSRELPKRLTKVIDSSKHQALMEHRTEEVFVAHQSLSEEGNRVINKFVLEAEVSSFLLGKFFGLALKG